MYSLLRSGCYFSSLGLFAPRSSNVDPGASGSSIFGSAAPLFGNPSAEPVKSLFGKSETNTSSGLFQGGSGLFGSPQSSVARSAGTRPNTPVFEENEETPNIPVQPAVPSLFSKPPPTVLFGKSALFGSDKPTEESAPSSGLFSGGATARFLAEGSADSAKIPSQPKINRSHALFGGKTSSSAGGGGIFTSSSQSVPKKSIKSRLGTAVQNPEEEEEQSEGLSQPRPRQVGRVSNPFVWTKSADGRADQGEEEEESPDSILGSAAARGGNLFGAESTDDKEVSETGSECSEQSQTGPATRPHSSVRKPVSKQVSKEELATITSIRCEEVPDVINKKAILSKHFAKFGEVVNVLPNLKKKTALVHFSDHKAAKMAKKNGKPVSQKVPPIGHIFYYQSSPNAKTARKTSEEEVSAELGAMSGGSSEVPLFAVKPVRPLPVKKKIFSMTKALQSAAEERPTPAEPETQITITQGASITELLRIMKQQTHSDDDRWKVLDARDKYVRIKYPKKQLRSGLEIEDMNLIGTCPDICPEKERYGRSAKNQLRWYEKEEGRLNHLTAVKEHSRSAADQDVPLPHELRPPSVLNKTMNFLMSNIVDRVDNMTGTMGDWFNFISQLSLGECQPTDPWSQFYVADGENSDETVGDWYEYMWSVTRAIRKDITQQNLTDLVSLSIVEKCARFHIFCSERLCEESAHDFASKLNDENLTKCLRTLKHMYHDLQVSGVYCPQETEFRAYDVLMNLNEGDTLREIQTLSEEIQKDPQVEFALKSFKALNSNNYVLFFKLARKATYLEACILKRYFYQVRRMAVKTIIAAYVPGKQMIQFPIEDLVNWLAFESEAECTTFLRQHGVESEEGVAFLERRSFMEVENIPPMTRSRLLIDSKRTVSLGEVVNGGPLEDNPYLEYYPHDSFDDNGFLKQESYEAEDQVVTMSPEELERISLEEEKKRRKKELAAHIVDDVCREVCFEEANSVCETALQWAENKETSVRLLGTLEKEFVDELISSVALETLREKRNDLLIKKLQENEKAEKEAELCNEIIGSWVETLVRDICQEEMTEVVKQRKLNKLLRHAEPIITQIIESVITKDLEDVAKLAILECEKETEEKVRMFSKKIRNKKLVAVLRGWSKLAKKSARQRETIINFPPGVSSLSCQEQNSRLGWSQNSTVSRQSLQEVLRNRQQLDWMMRAKDLENALVESAILEPFPLLEMLKPLITNNLEALQWKLLFCSPTVTQQSREASFLEMIKRKLRKSVSGDSSDKFILHKTVPVCETLLTLTVVDVSSVQLSCSGESFLGETSCLLFVFLPALETEEEAADRFASLMSRVPRVAGGYPLVLLSPVESDYDYALFGLDRLVQEGIISRYDRFSASENIFDVDNIVKVTEAVQTLVKYSQLSLDSRLTTKTLRDFVEDFLTTEVFSLFYINLRDRRSRDLPDRPASDLLGLYNSGLDHCVKVLEEGEVHSDVVNKIIRLKLPEMIVHDSDSWRQVVEQVMVYVDKIAVAGVDTSVTVANIERYLARTYRMFLRKCGDPQLDIRAPPVELLSWTDIVHSLILYRTSSLAEQETVSYDGSKLGEFRPGQQWNSGLGWAGERELETVQESLNSSLAAARERTLLLPAESPCINRELRDKLRREQKRCMR